jgi:hypothetical protein
VRPDGNSIAPGPRGPMPPAPNAARGAMPFASASRASMPPPPNAGRANMPLSTSVRQPMPFE